MTTNTLQLLSLAIFGMTSVGAYHWGYYNTGPDREPAAWPSHIPTCGGQHQSPIDLVPEDAIFDDTLIGIELNGYDVVQPAGTFQLGNSGHNIGCSIKKGTSITISGEGFSDAYDLIGFHMHWGSDASKGSEHTVDGHHYAAEVHFVHRKASFKTTAEAVGKSDGLAVLGFFIEIGDTPNKAFDVIFNRVNNIPFSDSPLIDLPEMALIDLLPENRDDFYRYDGSLTTPDCNEAVRWTVFKNPVQVTKNQLDSLRSGLFNSKIADVANSEQIINNYRVTQDLNGRDVYKTFGEKKRHLSRMFQRLLSKLGY